MIDLHAIFKEMYSNDKDYLFTVFTLKRCDFLYWEYEHGYETLEEALQAYPNAILIEKKVRLGLRSVYQYEEEDLIP